MTLHTSEEQQPLTDFYALTPDVVIGEVERALGRELTGLCRQLNSYINRVFELQTEDGEGIIAKFYRPGRWTRDALQDEHDFAAELAEGELPVIAPLPLVGGGTLAEHRGMYFTVFPKKSGRRLDEPTYDEWEQIGRLIARMHNVGALRSPRDRITMAPEESMRANVEYIVELGVIPPDIRRDYEATVNETIALTAPMFEGVEMIRIHGDCHPGNVIYRPGETFYLIDFDDMSIGPPVQDFWMLLPEYSHSSLVEIDMFLEGYQTFREFDRRTLRLIEPLRSMRFVHFTAWCAAQAADGGFAKLAPNWGTPAYWREEIRDLKNQQQEILDTRDRFWGM